MGAVALWDLVLNNDWNGILPFITVVGFMAPGIALLIVGKQLNYALVDIESGLLKQHFFKRSKNRKNYE